MATLNELGRNSASITYGGTATGSDLWPTLALVDQWLTNDTLQGTATASSTTVTGTGTVFVTQVRAGDVIMIAGQMRTVASVTSDTVFTVTSAFSPAVSVASAIKVINTTLTGNTTTTTVRGNTFGTVSVTNGSTTITGSNTYFLTEATNSVTPVSVSGTVAVAANGLITGTSTSFVTSQGGANGLYPGDSITVVSTGTTYYFEVATVTSDTEATVITGPASAISAGATLTKAQNGVSGRVININGRIRTVAAISTNGTMTVNLPMDFTDSNLRYRAYPRGTIANAVGGTLIQSTGCSSSGTTLTVAATLTGVIVVGAGLNLTSGTGTLVTGTTIANQLYGATGAAAATTTATGSSGGNTITVGSATGILVGQLISGNGAVVSGIDPSTYVTAISGTTITLSKNLTGNLSGTTVYFYLPGGLGGYTLSSAATVNLSAATVQFSSVIGTGANFAWDLQTGDQVWIGDELRTFNFATDGTAIASATTGNPIVYGYTTDYTGYAGSAINVVRQLYQGQSFRRDESYINGSGTSFTTELRVGDELIIDGTEVNVTQILSNTQMRVRQDFTHTLSTSTIYKKKKIHGFVLEGTREGGTTAGNKLSQANTILATTNTVYPIGTNTIVVASAPTVGQYNFIKIHGAGGTPTVLTGTINTVSASTTVTGTSTLFTTQLHVGAEISIAGQYFVVTAIASDTSMTVSANCTVTGPVPFYRTIPLYTYIASIASTTITLGHTLRHPIYATAANPCIIYTPNTGADFIEYVYSAPNKSAEASTLLFNTSLDRKYFGFRFYPLMQNAATYVSGTQIINGYTPNATSTISTALSGWNTPVYERWVAAYGQTGGVGINLADCSGGTVMIGTQTTTTFTLNNLIAGTITIPTSSTQYAPFTLGITANSPTALASGTFNAASSTYTAPSNTIGASSVVLGAISGVFDTQVGTQTTGGFIYLFATPRYFVIQGKSFANVPNNLIGCVEFERAQPEDSGTGLGTTLGVTYSTFSLTTGVGGSQTVQGMGASAVLGTPAISPWPCFGYINGQRLPVGGSQYPSLPNPGNAPVHGNVISIPRVRNSAGDLVGVNSHIYSAMTITTGRWGHTVELGGTGAYLSPGTIASNGIPAQTGVLADTIPQIHMGQIVPVFTNVYNSKRFMFSPVVVLGPAYDPDVRGRLYGFKVIPSGLGTLMDTVSITTDSNFFYDATQSANDHWVLGAQVGTFRFTLRASTSQIQQSWRSLEDTSTQAANLAAATYNNSFRYALPA
ncbi:hypothetical protein EB118_08745 [bacterium]|nr:hypothetical protein [bacterium]